MTPLEIAPVFPHLVDSTIRKEWDACQRKCYTAHFCHIHPKEESVHLVFGGALARSVEVFRVKFYSEEMTVEQSLAYAIQALLLDWGDYEPPERETKKTLIRCIDTVLSFFEHYNAHTDVYKPVILSETGAAVEWTFALPIPGCFHPVTGKPILYAGRFDMLAQSRKGAKFINDEKTTSSLGRQWSNQWQMASQFTGYYWAAQQFGHKIRGAVVRGIGIMANSTDHVIVLETRSQFEIDRWLVQLQHNVHEMINAWNTNYYNYALDNACNSYGGCPYMPLCTAKVPEKEYDRYKIRVWNPLASTDPELLEIAN